MTLPLPLTELPGFGGASTRPRAVQFATHAALALSHARHDRDLTEAIANRELIGQAVGMLVERYEITEDRAFHYLARVSSVVRVKLRDVAREVVDQGHRRAVAATSDRDQGSPQAGQLPVVEAADGT